MAISIYISSNGSDGDYASASIMVEDNNNDDNIYIATEIGIILSDGLDNNFELYQGISNTIIKNVPTLLNSSEYDLNITNYVKFGLTAFKTIFGNKNYIITHCDASKMYDDSTPIVNFYTQYIRGHDSFHYTSINWFVNMISSTSYRYHNIIMNIVLTYNANLIAMVTDIDNIIMSDDVDLNDDNANDTTNDTTYIEWNENTVFNCNQVIIICASDNKDIGRIIDGLNRNIAFDFSVTNSEYNNLDYVSEYMINEIHFVANL